MGHPGHAGGLVRRPSFLPEAKDGRDDQEDEEERAADDHEDGQDRGHRELAHLGERALARFRHPLRLLGREGFNLGDVTPALSVGRRYRHDVAGAGSKPGHGEPRRLGVGRVGDDEVGGRVGDLHGEELRQAAVESRRADDVKRRQRLVVNGAVLDRVGSAGGYEVEDAGVGHSADGVGGPAHQRSVVHLSLKCQDVDLVGVENTGFGSWSCSEFVNFYLTSLIGVLKTWIKPP